MRRAFANEWKRVFERTNGNVRFTWEIVKRRYPYMRHAVRRYFIKPSYYITKLQEVPFDVMEKMIISTWSKDFSKKVRISILQKFKSAMQGRRDIKRKARRSMQI